MLSSLFIRNHHSYFNTHRKDHNKRGKKCQLSYAEPRETPLHPNRTFLETGDELQDLPLKGNKQRVLLCCS